MQPKLEPTDDVSGTFLLFELDVKYQDLVEAFGEPNLENDGYKVDAEWAFKLVYPDGKVITFTIYNYKTGRNYLGDAGQDTEDITDWHFGGRTRTDRNEIMSFVTGQLSK